MLPFYLLFFLLLIPNQPVISFSRSPTHNHHFNNKSIFILAGQSNMAGRGGIFNDTSTGFTAWDAVVPDKCRSNPAILRLDAQLQWVEATAPLHRDIDFNKTCGVGPGMVFANSLLGRRRIGSGAVGLVPCAIGGTVISRWAQGSPLYQQLIERARASVRGGGTVKAVLWFQGESDTVNEADAAAYGRRLEQLLLDLRADLQDPSLPVILVAIGSAEGPFIEAVRKAQLGINLPNVIVVDAMGLTLGPDNLHLTTAAQVHLGEMLGRAYLNFHPSPIRIKVLRNVSPSSFHLYFSRAYWTLIVAITLFFVFLMWKAVKRIHV